MQGKACVKRDGSWRREGNAVPRAGHIRAFPSVPPGPVPRSYPVGMGDSSGMSTVQPRSVLPLSSCSWEVIGTYFSTGT